MPPPPHSPRRYGAVSVSLNGDVALAAMGAEPDSTSSLVMVEYSACRRACRLCIAIVHCAMRV